MDRSPNLQARGQHRARLGPSLILSLLALSLVAANTGCLYRMESVKNTAPVVHKAQTSDGWKLALHRYPVTGTAPAGDPIIFCHGISSNRFNWGVDAENSLPVFLSRRGHDVWLLELRGAGESEWPEAFGGKDYDWSFDTYVQYDVPAAIDYVRTTTGKARVNWIGHSMGGMIILAYMASYPAGPEQAAKAPLPPASEPPLGWVVTLGSPTKKGPIDRESKVLQFIVPFETVVKTMPFVPGNIGTKMIAPFSAWGETFWDLLIWNKKNMDRKTIKYAAANAVNNISRGVALEFIKWLKTGQWMNVDDSFDFRANLQRITTPALIVAGSLDGLAPPTHVEPGFELLRSPLKRYLQLGRNYGFSADYGHVDMVMGLRAADEVFPKIADFVDEAEAYLAKTDPTPRMQPSSATAPVATAAGAR
ncbi:MAG: alpha/beta fold hydrolase [Candidatus Schekmanbacteria bacterium]|nr:alpha/beta fold hydrolase [Candidatus Schekmanbacteria bacterium]